jgi:hypothetical protein
MKHAFRILPVLSLALCLTSAPARAQGPSMGGGSSNPWSMFEEQLGLETTYSVDMVISAMGMNMDSRIVRDGGRTRTEMTMPFLNMKTVVLEIPQGDRTVSYTLFPDKKKRLANEDLMEAAADLPTPRIEELGTEEYEGVTCVKRRVTMEQEGMKSRIDILFSPKVRDMPVKMTVQASLPPGMGQPDMPMESTVLFRNYDFGTPDDSQFAVPADYDEVSDMMEIMMGDESEGLGALMQQMQMETED